MSGSWKKTWTVRSHPGTVIGAIRMLPRVYADGLAAGILGRMGRTYAHQRKDIRPKSPRLILEKGWRLIFQHDLISPFTYAVELFEELDKTRVQLEVKSSGSSRDASSAEQVAVLLFALSRAVEAEDA
ncbi:MAG: hypothetical protein DRI34_02800 [Deltaproteobacteria bacterium]|nr:MAG: hypothetical protein DRI34_02800 [Deltaproteobacteria bacterium]